jgi:beta-galactosidase
MGNSLGNFYKYWDLFYQYPRLQGGFNWDWVDQGLRSQNEKGMEYWNVVNHIDGANVNDGLINPDRIPQPEMNEFKKIIQNIRTEAIPNKMGEIRITNLFFFKTLDDIEMNWEVNRDGIAIKSGKETQLKIGPQEAAIIKLPIDNNLIREEGVYFLNLSFRQKNETPFAEKGFEIAKEQIELGVINGMATRSNNPGIQEKISWERGKIIKIQGADFDLGIDTITGAITEYNFRGLTLVSEPILPCFWRVPTDNDEGGGAFSYAHLWRQAGLENYKINIKSIAINPQKSGSLSVQITSILSFKSGDMRLRTQYEVDAQGGIDIEMDLEILDKFPPLARVGMTFSMPKQFDRITWYGRGPFESYQDRNRSAHIGLYAGAVADQYFEYVMPQENGNKTEVRWLKIMDRADTGLKISGSPQMEVNVQNYSQKALNDAKTSHILVRGDRTNVHVDLKQMGLGGDDSWTPRVHKEFLLEEKKYNFRFRLNAF